MKSVSSFIVSASLLLLLAVACSGGVDSPDENQGDNDQGDSQLTDDGNHDDDGTDDDGDGDGGDSTPGDQDGTGCQYAGAGDNACPAPTVCASQHVVFDENDKNGWTHFSFGSNASVQSGTACSGTKAFKTDVHQFEGLAFNHGPTVFDLSDVPATHVSIRVWVSEASAWTVAATPLSAADPDRPAGSKDGHCYRLPFANCGEGFEGICGPNQEAAPCILHWVTGWNIVELDIPAETGGAIAQIMFERQIESGSDSAVITVVVDDLRLTQP